MSTDEDFEAETTAAINAAAEAINAAAAAINAAAEAEVQLSEKILETAPSPEAYMATQSAAVGHLEQAEAQQTTWPKKTWYEEHVAAGSHRPVQHRDGKPAWCRLCGLTADGNVPMSRFHNPQAVVTTSGANHSTRPQPTEGPETKDVVAIAQDLLRGYGHDAVADALAAAPREPSEDWIERVNRALWRYDNEYLTVRGVADVLSGPQWSDADRNKRFQQLRTLIEDKAQTNGWPKCTPNAGEVAEAVLDALEGDFTHE